MFILNESFVIAQVVRKREREEGGRKALRESKGGRKGEQRREEVSVGGGRGTRKEAGWRTEEGGVREGGSEGEVIECVSVSATVLNEGNKVHTELLPFQEWASGCSY